MSGLAELSQRHARLHEINGLMKAMKSLSLVETRKLARFIGHQQRMRAAIEDAAADFLQFHPEFGARDPTLASAVVVVIGSERGFCGSFNERIVQALDGAADVAGASLLVVGQRLAARLAGRERIAASVDGATVSEDVPAVLDRLVDALHALRDAAPHAPATLLCLAHDDRGDPVLGRLLPLPLPTGPPKHRDAPLLQLAPAVFHAGLVDQFLLAALYGQLYTSLAAESHQRLAHMEHALERLDQTLQQLVLERNALRQERIVEEIEVMLSSAMAAELGAAGAATDTKGRR